MGQVFNLTNTDDDLGGLTADQGAPPLQHDDRPRYDAFTALVVVDVQNDLADPAGPLAVDGGPEVVRRINEQIAQAAEAGAMVVYSQNWHPPAAPTPGPAEGRAPLHCVRDTWGAELHPALVVDGPTVRKGKMGEDGYSAFTAADPDTQETSPTELAGMLEGRSIERAVIVGLALEGCVKATALDAKSLGFTTTVVRNATAPVAAAAGERAAETLGKIGVAVADA